MPKQNPGNVDDREITPPAVYFNRRNFMRAGVLAATTVATAGLYRTLLGPRQSHSNLNNLARIMPIKTPDATQPSISGALTTAPSSAPATQQAVDRRGFATDEPLTSFDDITHYNNFYEFTQNKSEVADAAANFVTRPWKIEVGGLVGKPRTFDLDELLKLALAEERVYRMRCVEAWSMVIPWDGFSLSKLLDAVQPNSSAKYVAFQSLHDPDRMPGQREDGLAWPYVEGLRMDEAMHPLTILASGIYSRALPPQDGAPIRLVVPWKYGFKGIKSIVKIDLVADQPPTTWNIAAPDEYGFYANVNPQVDHPRWSQATELRIGEINRRNTLRFNGYAAEVGSLYAGMNLRKFF